MSSLYERIPMGIETNSIAVDMALTAQYERIPMGIETSENSARPFLERWVRTYPYGN